MSDSAIPITEDMVIEWVRDIYKNNDSARIKIDELREELELYKKALEISCEWNELNLGYLTVDECLQKARGEQGEFI